MRINKFMKRKIIIPVILTLIIVFILIVGYNQLFIYPKFEEIQFVDMNDKMACLRYLSGEYVIDSNEEYIGLLEHESALRCEEDFELPSIDFSQYTLLGKYAE